jgi:hypothetical protein
MIKATENCAIKNRICGYERKPWERFICPLSSQLVFDVIRGRIRLQVGVPWSRDRRYQSRKGGCIERCENLPFVDEDMEVGIHE